jgi:hypothetical protein
MRMTKLQKMKYKRKLGILGFSLLLVHFAVGCGQAPQPIETPAANQAVQQEMQEALERDKRKAIEQAQSQK